MRMRAIVNKKKWIINRIKFLIFSGVFSFVLKSVLHNFGILGDFTIIGEMVFEGKKLAVLFASLLLAGQIGMICLSFRRNVWAKVLGAAAFPNAIILTLRTQYVFGVARAIYYLCLMAIVLPLVVCISSSWMVGSLSLTGRSIRRSLSLLWNSLKDYIHEDLPKGFCFYICWLVVVIMMRPDMITNLKTHEVWYSKSYINENQNGNTETDCKRAESLTVGGPFVRASNSLFINGREGELCETNREGLCLLKKDIYDDLQTQDKLNALLTLVDIESQYLFNGAGEIALYMGKPERDTVQAYYANGYSTIVISEEAIGDRDTAISCVLHEVRHAYQERVIDYLMEKKVFDNPIMKQNVMYEWAYEEANYCEGSEDYFTYYTQSIEIDARNYCAEWLQKYINFIEGI